MNRTREFTITLGGVIMFPTLLAAAFASVPLIAVLLIAVILFGFQLSMGKIRTLPSDYYSGKSVGTLVGIGGTAAVLGVLLTTNIVPVITVDTYAPYFILGACLVPLSIGSAWLIGGHIEQVKEDAPRSE